MTTATTTNIMAILAVLNEKHEAKSRVDPEDNPYKDHDLQRLSHGSLKAADDQPALNMAAKWPTALSWDMEASRHKVAEEGRQDKSAKRMATARARAERKVEYDNIAASPTIPSQARMDEAWLVVVNLVVIIEKVAKSKQRWANRLLGSNADDIPQMACEKIALVLAKQTKFDLDVLTTAAVQLGKIDNGIPGDQTYSDDDPAHVKAVKKARKWLMGMVHNRIMGALVDSYTSINNLRWENLDIITTVMASIGGVGDDPMMSRFMADKAPSFMGARFQRPGGVDSNLLAVAVSAAFTEKGLDPLVEFILDDEHRRTDGAVEWTKYAETIFQLTPGGYGGWMWEQVVAATINHTRVGNVRGEAAMNHVRNLFKFLPGLIVDIVESFDPHMIGWSPTDHRAVLASDFELFYLSDAKRSQPLMPALRYPTSKEAAVVLAGAVNGMGS